MILLIQLVATKFNIIGSSSYVDSSTAASGNNDSKFVYNITSATNDIFGNGNLITEGPYIDTTVTDRAILNINENTFSIENINGENFLNISGKIENYQSLVDAYGQFTIFERINYKVENVENGSSSDYDFDLEFQKPLDENIFVEFFDFSMNVVEHGDFGASPVRTSVWCSPTGAFFLRKASH